MDGIYGYSGVEYVDYNGNVYYLRPKGVSRSTIDEYHEKKFEKEEKYNANFKQESKSSIKVNIQEPGIRGYQLTTCRRICNKKTEKCISKCISKTKIQRDIFKQTISF